MSPKLRKRSRPVEITDSPFYRIERASEAIVERWRAGGSVADEAAAWRRKCDGSKYPTRLGNLLAAYEDPTNRSWWIVYTPKGLRHRA